MKNRRKFLQSTSLLIGGLLLPPFSSRLKAAEATMPEASPDDQPGKELRIRKNVNALTADDPIIKSYKKAVQKMKQLPASDLRNWNNQAEIHNKECSHGNWFFLPWHRAYLHSFEEICRELSGDEMFTLPYWNWTDFPQLPASFWGTDNPLNNSTRRVRQTDAASSEMVGGEAVGGVMQEQLFPLFGGAASQHHKQQSDYGILEIQPHNYIHRFVQGDMVTMLSPLDPIFWLHHANVDRIWAEWNDKGHQNPADPGLLNYVFDGHFCDRKGTKLSITVKNMLDHRNIGYRYDTQPALKPSIQPVFFISANRVVATNKMTFSTISKSPKTATLALTSDIASQLESVLAKFSALPSVPKAPAVQLAINDITPPANENFLVRVFINCPYLSVDTPLNDPHYVTSFTFFGSAHHSAHEHHDHSSHDNNTSMGGRYVFDITKTLKNIQGSTQKTELEKNLNVQLLAVPLAEGVPATLKIGKFEILLAES